MNKEKQEIFLELLSEVNDSLFMYALALEKSKANAEDLVQDTIIATYEKFEEFRNYASFKGYIFKVLRSKFRQKYRRSWLFGKYEEYAEKKMISNDYIPDLPLEIETLYKALNELPEKQKEALVLFEISGFSIEEICNIQNSSLSAVKSRLKRAREKLRVIIQNQDDYIKSEEFILFNN